MIDLDDLEAKARVVRQDVAAFQAHNEDRGWPVDDLGTACMAFEVADAVLDLVAEVRRLRCENTRLLSDVQALHAEILSDRDAWEYTGKPEPDED